ncbi:predicted protein [Chaetomium globosum CBS 148.51]|uniref:Uncharacterized protein n=1 Tax=Chaetomium globosum (strain ATCC 6205 / CBS 148.51 / DSM 1962 / NBRC 6347 / NRRL 1970) TaxID=306901 RepID=Q2GPE8_CHAGB|nr:uncharacterized protein CHGG_10156 [Chaetomium globosum CBS 148.51]EAQ83752.1 predicted protein [Chaetomium globosum CBS 148.51]
MGLLTIWGRCRTVASTRDRFWLARPSGLWTSPLRGQHDRRVVVSCFCTGYCSARLRGAMIDGPFLQGGNSKPMPVSLGP